MISRALSSFSLRKRRSRCLVTHIPNCLHDKNSIPVTVSRSPSEIDKWISTYVSSTKSDFIGFDIEWRPTYRSGEKQPKAATIQLATPQAALIAQLSHMNSTPTSIVDTLGDDQLVKVGVGVKGDLTRLKKDYNLAYAGFSDIVDIEVL